MSKRLRTRVCAVLLSVLPPLVTGCGASSSSSPSSPATTAGSASPAPPPIGLEEVQTRLLGVERLGAGWSDQTATNIDADTRHGAHVPRLCAEKETAPAAGSTYKTGPAIGDAQVAAMSASKDMGPPVGRQPQSLTQLAAAFPGEQPAEAFVTRVRGVAEACPKQLSVPAEPVDGGQRTAPYVETVAVENKTEGAWSGFAVVREQRYASSADANVGHIAVAVLRQRNAVIIVEFRLYAEPAVGGTFAQLWPRYLGELTAAAFPAPSR
nr:hypothetical protein GCM10020063_009510 [Dactylosporangium thailandense]